jgi:hypothetical protein
MGRHVMKNWIGPMVLALGIAGCTSIDPTYTPFMTEAGGGNSTTSFGAATLNNRLVQAGQHAVAAERGYGQLLNGKYAATVMTEYESSASPVSTLTESRGN